MSYSKELPQPEEAKDAFLKRLFNRLKEISAKHPVSMLGATALYFISPVDASGLDFLPPLTYIDDAFVATAFLAGIMSRKQILDDIKADRV